MDHIQYQCLAGVSPVEVQWLWPPFIAFGKITLLQGDPGEGKSTVAIDLAARLSRGDRMPDGTPTDGPGTVLYLCREDGLQDTIIPRFQERDADLKNIGSLVGEQISLLNPQIEQIVRDQNIKLLIVDPIQDFWDEELDMQRAASVRKQMRQLSALALKTGCAILLVGHLNKRESANHLHRGLGSVDIVAAARSVLQISRLDSHSTVRVLSQIKNNIAPEGDDMAFELSPEQGLQWIGKIDLENEREGLVSEARNGSLTKQDLAAEYLCSWLQLGDMSANEIESRLEELGITYRTAKYVKQELGIRSVKKADGWYWHLETSG